MMHRRYKRTSLAVPALNFRNPYLKDSKAKLDALKAQLNRIKIGQKTAAASRPRQRYSNYRKLRNVAVQGNGGQITRFSSRIAPKPFYRKLIKSVSNSSYYTNNAGRASQSPGKQTFFLNGCWLGGSQVGNPLYSQDLVNLLQDINGVYAGTIAPLTTKIYLKSLQQTMRVTNQDNGNVEILIYDVVCKKDNSNAPSDHWATGLTNESTAGVISGAVSSTAAYTLVGCKPTQSLQFNTYWKIVQKHRLILGAGQCHTHVVNLQPNRWMTMEELYEGHRNFAGLSYYTMVIASGMPQNDTTTLTQVSTGGVALDYVFTRMTNVGFVANNKEISFTANNLPISFTVNESVMETDGDKTTQQQA